jgi:hypothetical protein
MTRLRTPKVRAGLLIAAVTSAALAMASLAAVVDAAPAGATSTTISWVAQPGAGTGGVALSPQPKVTTNDLTDGTTSISLTLAGGTAGAVLTCDQASNTMTVVLGVAAFTGCKVDKAGSNYTITATSTPSLTGSPLISNPFTITFGAANKLAFTTQPGNGEPAQNLSAQPVVSVEDAGGNVVTTDQTTVVTLAILNNAGPGGVLTCTSTLTVTTVNGVATFTGCKIDLLGVGYTLSANSTVPVLPQIASAAFNVGAFHLVFAAPQPNGGAGGAIWTHQPKVEIRDANGVVTTSTASIALTITLFTPATGGPGTLTCTVNPVIAVLGVATFAGCEIDTGGMSYRLTATDAADGISVASSPFDIVGPTAPPQRIFGFDAIDTSIAVSQHGFPINGSASAVVLARSDFFSDALAGGPLAAIHNAPLLITPGTPVASTLDLRVKAEIQRVLPTSHTVYILGGPLAVPGPVDSTLTGLGYTVVRVQGINANATAVAIADQLGDPTTVFEVTGLNFADAVSAGPAVIDAGGAILLTNGPTQAPETAAYLAAHTPSVRYAIGGPLAAYGADPSAIPVYGQDLFATSSQVAARFYPVTLLYGVATGLNFPDALSGGVFMATGGRHGPMLLVNTNAPLPASIAAYLSLQAHGTPGVVFGGPIAVGDDVITALAAVVG